MVQCDGYFHEQVCVNAFSFDYVVDVAAFTIDFFASHARERSCRHSSLAINWPM